MMQNEILTIRGKRWLVKKALSEQDAINEIAQARITGSVGSKTTKNDGEKTVVVADVVQINSDGTERQPYTDLY